MQHALSATCSFCRDRLAPHEAMRGDVCSKQNCRGKARLRDNERQRAERVAGYDAIAQDFAAKRDDNDPAIRIPYFARGFGRTDPARIKTFRAYLRGVFREATQKVETIPEDELTRKADPELSDHPRLVTSCIACRGFCCRMGKNHAFLTPTGIAKAIVSRSSETPAQIYRDYIRRIPVEAYENSCVYQGAEGCVLPRDVRGPACNSFECTERLNLRSALEDDPDASVLLVAMDDDTIGAVVRTSPETPLDWVGTDT